MEFQLFGTSGYFPVVTRGVRVGFAFLCEGFSGEKKLLLCLLQCFSVLLPREGGWVSVCYVSTWEVLMSLLLPSHSTRLLGVKQVA